MGQLDSLVPLCLGLVLALYQRYLLALAVPSPSSGEAGEGTRGAGEWKGVKVKKAEER